MAIRPVAVGYRKVTNDTTRRLFSNFFANVHSPITIVNDVLQANLKEAAKATGRLVINTTIGVVGFFGGSTDRAGSNPVGLVTGGALCRSRRFPGNTGPGRGGSHPRQVDGVAGVIESSSGLPLETLSAPGPGDQR